MKTKTINLFASTLLIASVSMPAIGGTTWTLDKSTFQVDTLYHAATGPGITQTSLMLSGAAKERIFYTTIDLSNQYADMKVTTANDNASGYATLSSVCKRKTVPGKKYITGVNADFFSGSQALGSAVVDGRPVLSSSSSRPSWYITDQRKMGIGYVQFKGTATCNGDSHAMAAINGGRGSNALVLFTDAYGSSYKTNGLGLEVAVKPIDGAPAFVGHLKVEVLAQPSVNTIALKSDQWALSGNQGTPENFLKNLKPGDIVDLSFDTALPVAGNIRDLAGGYPVMIRNNKLQTITPSGGYEHVVENHPRTCIGYNSDRTKAIILVCDGRSSISSGMTVSMLAHVMKQLGCSDALNYDGGGSTEMYSYDFGIINRPSDGSERAVPDAVWAVSIAPADDTPVKIAFEAHSTVSAPRYGCLTPRIYAYNQYGDLIDTNFQDYTLSCDNSFGEISVDGKSVTLTGEGCHALTATFGSSTVSIPVEVSGAIEGKILVSKTVIDNIHPFIVPCGAEINGEIIPVDGALLSWSSSAPSVASVDENGIVHGISNGEAVITGKNGDYSGSITITVESVTKASEELDLTATNWTLSKSGMNSASHSNDNGNLKINYNIKTARSANFTLKNEQKLYSRPDRICMEFSAGEKAVKSIVVSFKDNNGNTYSEEIAYEASKSNETAEIDILSSIKNQAKVPARIANANPDIETIYPLSLVSIRFNINGTANSGGTVRIKSLKTVYDDFNNSGIKDIITEINPDEPIEYYNLQGMKVNPDNLSGGIYILRQGGRSGKVLIR